MKKLTIWLALCMLLLLGGCGEKQPSAFEIHKHDVVGTWQMVSRTDQNGTVTDTLGEKVFFTYTVDGKGEKTIDGKTEYTLTFSYDGKQLYTTAQYIQTEETHLRNDLCTVTGDSMTIFSYDENTTVTLKKVS